jgi:hypothetical protein
MLDETKITRRDEMSDKRETVNIFDPTGMLKGMRDAGMEQWSKAMTDFVMSDAYASANAEMLNAWLTTSSPFRKSMETAVNQSLSAMNIASRDDYMRLADRLTNIELRLDDLDAKLDEWMRQHGSQHQG